MNTKPVFCPAFKKVGTDGPKCLTKWGQLRNCCKWPLMHQKAGPT